MKKAPPFLLSNVTHTPGILRGRKRKINGRYACVCTCVGDAGAVDERSASIKRKKKKKACIRTKGGTRRERKKKNCGDTESVRRSL